jgi:competence protein ComEC
MGGSEPLDLRLVPLALAAWAGAAVGIGWTPGRAVAAALLLWMAGATVLGRSRVSGQRWLVVVATLLVTGGALASAGLRADAVRAGPLGALASQRAAVHVSGRVTTDPVRKRGQFGPMVLVSLTVRSVTARGIMTAVRSPVLVIGPPSWLDVAFGAQVEGFGHLQPADGPDLAAVLVASGAPTVTQGPGWVDGGVARVRAGLTEAATPLAPPERALLPALVDGDVSSMPDQTTADFKTTGLTHLLAVSGSNLTLVLGFVLFMARWVRIRGYGIAVVGMVAVVFFVLLARPQPSVLRAAAMGVVAMAGLSTGSRPRGDPGLVRGGGRPRAARSVAGEVGRLLAVDPCERRDPRPFRHLA